MKDQTIKFLKQILEAQKETAALLAISLKRDTLQTTLIEEMGEVGISPRRIAELLNTSPNTVSVTLSRARKKKD
ncbi:MAG: sigma factor-like helix-turn-helix DNA-binding protein [Candidatus Paceibacterota bacterium]